MKNIWCISWQSSNTRSKNGHTLVNDIKTCVDKYDGNFFDFHKSESKNQHCTMKCINVQQNFYVSYLQWWNPPGPVLMYTNYVKMEGIQIFKIYLKYFGFSTLW